MMWPQDWSLATLDIQPSKIGQLKMHIHQVWDRGMVLNTEGGERMHCNGRRDIHGSGNTQTHTHRVWRKTWHRLPLCSHTHTHTRFLFGGVVERDTHDTHI
jgi:hypothetical protein